MKSDFPLCFQVFVDQLTSKDMEFIADSIFPSIDKEIIAKMVEFSNRVGFSFHTPILFLSLMIFFMQNAAFPKEDTVSWQVVH